MSNKTNEPPISSPPSETPKNGNPSLSYAEAMKNKKMGLTAKGDQRHFVKHCYKDHANDLVDNLTESDENTLRLYRENNIGGTFPVKLQIVLKVVERLGQQHIISWLPHGRSFMIHRPREFEDEVMGKFFKQTKLTSFQRQLNLYDFQRITHGRDSGSYYHELFLRGRPLLAKRMVRRKVKGTKIRASSSPDDEPNFYTMSAVAPICTNDTFSSSSAARVPKPEESMYAPGGTSLRSAENMQANVDRPSSSQFLAGRTETLPGPPLHGQYDQSALQQLCNISTSLHNNPLLNSSLNSLPFQQQNNFYTQLMQHYGNINPLFSGVADGMSGFPVMPHTASLSHGGGPMNDFKGNNSYPHHLSTPSALQQNLLAGSSLGLPHDQLANAAYKNDIALLNRDAAMLNSLSGWRNNTLPPAPSGLEPNGLSYLSNVATSGEDASNSQLLLQLQQLQQQQQQQQQQSSSLLLEQLQSNGKQE